MVRKICRSPHCGRPAAALHNSRQRMRTLGRKWTHNRGSPGRGVAMRRAEPPETGPQSAIIDDELLTFLGVGFERSCLAMLFIDGDQFLRCANSVAAAMLGTDDLAGRSVLDFCVQQTHSKSDAELA